MISIPANTQPHPAVQEKAICHGECLEHERESGNRESYTVPVGAKQSRGTEVWTGL